MPGVALEDYAHAKLIVLWGVNPSATGHPPRAGDRARARGRARSSSWSIRGGRRSRAAPICTCRSGPGDRSAGRARGDQRAVRARPRGPRRSSPSTRPRSTSSRPARPRWSIEAAAREAEHRPAQLEQFVELYAATSPAVIRVGWGLERNRNGGSAVAAVLALPAVAGKFGVRGGGYTMANSDAHWGVSAEAGDRRRPRHRRARST